MESVAKDNRTLTVFGLPDHLKNVLDQMNGFAYTHDAYGRITYCTRLWADIMGLTVDQTVGRRLLEFIPDREKERVQKEVARRIWEGVSQSYEVHIIDGNQNERLFRIQAAPLVMDAVTVGGLVMADDISDRKRAEDELRRSEERYRTIFENTGTAMIILGEDNSIIRANKEMELLTGYSRDEAEQRKWTEFVFPDDVERMALAHRARREPGNGSSWGYEFRLVRKGGELREVSLTAAMVPGTAQSIISLQDVTEARWAERRLQATNAELAAMLGEMSTIEEELRHQNRQLEGQKSTLAESERRFRSLLEDVRLLALIVDSQGKITFVNNFVLTLAGWKREELEGRHFRNFFPPSTRDRMVQLFETTIKRERLIRYGPAYVQKKDGGQLRVHWNNTLLMDAEQNVVGIATIGEDVTERWRTQKALKRSLTEMKQLLAGTVEALAAVAEKRDPYTAGHQRRVADLACSIAEEMGISGSRLEGLRTAGILHDIGKINIPAEILSKPGCLTEVETLLVMTHCEAGFEIVSRIPFQEPVSLFLLQHHERLNGSGYPRGLKGSEILLEARILGVADVVEAMASHRPYRPALGVKAALEEISLNSGILYDPQVVQVCCDIFRQGFKFAD